MSKPTKATLDVNGTVIAVLSQNEDDYLSLTDIARYKDPLRMDYLISNWLRNRNTIEFLGIWERLHNPAFNPIEFDGISMNLSQGERLTRLNQIAIRQMTILTASSRKSLPGEEKSPL